MDTIDKLLARIPPKHRKQLFEALLCLGDVSCRKTLRAQKLAGSKALYRIRAGMYRIIFHLDEQERAIVDDIRLRNEKTYRNL